ncbi:MAG: hypothetical protein K2X07_09380 [Caulobacteraceae bacterium]|nr:hypothetical protein [Caulobacteraceae bacterium]
MRTTRPDVYDRVNARLRLITRIAEMAREAGRMTSETPRARRAWARAEAMLERLQALPPILP